MTDDESHNLLALIAEINSAGFYVNNLFQLGAKGWQANITDGESYYEFSHGDTIYAALRNAYHKRGKGSPAYIRTQPNLLDDLLA